MTTPLPRELEPKIIADALSQIFNHMENKDWVGKTVQAITQAVETVTAKQDGLCKEIVGFVNKNQEEANKFTPKIKEIEEKKGGVEEELKESAKRLFKEASKEVQQHYQKTISPTSP